MLNRTLRQRFAAFFIAATLFVILFMNRTPDMITGGDRWLSEAMTPGAAYDFRRVGWGMQQYAYATGLDNRWIMFGRQSRFNWRFVFSALHTDGSDHLLPLPGQGERSLVQRYFLDFREAKFHLNIYSHPDLLERYGRHLCGAYPAIDGILVEAVRVELEYYMLHEPADARTAGTPVASPAYRRTLQEIRCGS